MNNDNSSPNSAHRKAQQAETKSQSAITRLADLVRQYIEQARTDEDQKKADEQRKNSKEKLTRSIAYAGFVVAALGLIINIIQAKTAHTTLYEAQRAYLSVSSPNVLFVEKKENSGILLKNSISVSVTNGGNTSARNVQISANIKTIEKNEKDIPIEDNYDTMNNVQKLPLGPKQTNTGGSVLVDFDTINHLGESNGKNKLIYYGKVTYMDIFNKNHELNFCWSFTAKGSPIPSDSSKDTPPWQIKPLGTVCSYHNCVDEDCNGFIQTKTWLEKIGL